jgi:hypothetical protein
MKLFFFFSKSELPALTFGRALGEKIGIIANHGVIQNLPDFEPQLR